MYISLKWKAVVFLSLVLITITAAWTWQIIDKQLAAFEQEINRSHTSQTDLLNELVADNFLKLSQFSELISGRQVVLQSIDKPHSGSLELIQTMEDDWLSYHINLGLDFLAIYDKQNNTLAKVTSPELVYDNKLRTAISGILKEKSVSNEPKNLLYCDESCLLIVLQPFISEKGETGTIVLAQNMAEIVRVFYDFSKAGLGILVSGDMKAQANRNERYLTEWDKYVWAVSDFTRVFPIIKHYVDSHPAGINSPTDLFTDENSLFLVASLNLPDISILGNQISFISVDDKTSSNLLVKTNIKRAIVTGVLGLFGAEIILLMLINGPMKKLENITESLHLLPQQNFTQAIKNMTGRKRLFMDELSTLEHSTVYVARELDKLHQEINLKNESLEQQVQALTRSRSFLTRLFDNSQIFIITQDFDFNIYSTNKKFNTLYDDAPSSFISLIYDEHQAEEFRDKAKSLIKHKIDVFQQEYNFLDKEGKNLIITWTHTLVEDEQGYPIILSIGMDQTRQKVAENELRWMANNDGLTSIGNRRSFNAEINEMLGNGVNGALVFIDVNRFKQINDIFGHNAGDQVLIDIADKLRKLTRASDTISRFAGDEFTILMAGIRHDDLPAVLSKLSTELSSSIELEDGRIVNYTVSIGASFFPDQGRDPQSLVINADMAMYHAKKKGMGHWHIFESSDKRVYQIKQDHNLILIIKDALKTNAFKLAYQPILDINKNRISHYEVLIRLKDASGNDISPAVFIPLAEKTGEIRNIDVWVLQHALSTLHDRVSAGDDMTIAINISAPTMQADDFPRLVFDALERYQIDTSRVIIELTETAYIDNFQQVLKNLKQITRKGVRVAIDDFGVGFSSFTYLKMLPLSYVKLDGSYIQNLINNPDDQVFVKSLSAMVNAFGMKIIAEFVGDEPTLNMIKQLGVTHGQGYFIGKPVPFEGTVTNRAELV